MKAQVIGGLKVMGAMGWSKRIMPRKVEENGIKRRREDVSLMLKSWKNSK